MRAFWSARAPRVAREPIVATRSAAHRGSRGQAQEGRRTSRTGRALVMVRRSAPPRPCVGRVEPLDTRPPNRPGLFRGGMPEWLNGAVSKTVVRATVPGVRIPLPPPVALRELFSAEPRPLKIAQRRAVSQYELATPTIANWVIWRSLGRIFSKACDSASGVASR